MSVGWWRFVTKFVKPFRMGSGILRLQASDTGSPNALSTSCVTANDLALIFWNGSPNTIR